MRGDYYATVGRPAAVGRDAPPPLVPVGGVSWRAATLEAAVLQPFLNPAELGLTHVLLEERRVKVAPAVWGSRDAPTPQ